MPFISLIRVLPLDQRRGIKRHEAADIWGSRRSSSTGSCATELRRSRAVLMADRFGAGMGQEDVRSMVRTLAVKAGVKLTAVNDDLDAELAVFAGAVLI